MSETATPASASLVHDAEIASALGKRCVVLIGMMGAGKSTIGRRIAARLRLPFVDADAEIETAAGMSIPDIFETHGEPHFRDGEARVIARLLESGPAVIATGGGAFMREETAPTGRSYRMPIPKPPSAACSTNASRSTGSPTSPSFRATYRTTRSSMNASMRCTQNSARRRRTR